MSPTLTPSSRLDRRRKAFMVLQGGVNAPPSLSADSEKIIKISLSSEVILTFVSLVWLAEIGSSRLRWDPRNRNPFIPSLHLERPMNLLVRHHFHFSLRSQCERPTNPPYASNQILRESLYERHIRQSFLAIGLAGSSLTICGLPTERPHYDRPAAAWLVMLVRTQDIWMSWTSFWTCLLGV